MNTLLLVTVAGSFLLFYFLSFVLILLDRENQDEPDSHITSPVPHAQGSITQIALFCSFIAIAILSWTILPEWQQQQWLIAILVPAIIPVAFYSLPAHFFSFRPPMRIGLFESALHLLITLLALGLCLYKWHEIPMGINADAADAARWGKELWTNGQSPLYITPQIVPAFTMVLDGLAQLLTRDPRFGLILHPLLCGILCPSIFQRLAALIMPRSAAWIAALIFTVSPMELYYSRVPYGSTLYLPSLVFLYALFRIIQNPSFKFAIVAGFALTIAQFNYHAARILVAYFFCVIPFVLIHRRFNINTIRDFATLMVVFVCTSSVWLLFKNLSLNTWTWYLVPKEVNPSSLLLSMDDFLRLIYIHVRMWFSDAGNYAGFHTIAGAPVWPFPFAPILVLGFGILLSCFYRIVPLFLLILFALGLTPSLLSSTGANSHRAMLSLIPVVIFIASPLGIAVEMARELNKLWKPILLFLLTLITIFGVIACIKWGLWGMWQDWGAQDAQQYKDTLRSLRIKNDIGEYRIQFFDHPSPLEQLVLDPSLYTIWKFNSWLQPNWVKEDVAVHSRSGAMSHFIATALPWKTYEIVLDKKGYPIGWTYWSDRIKIGEKRAKESWEKTQEVTGSIMFPSAGIFEIKTSNISIDKSPTTKESNEHRQMEFEVYQGLSRFVFRATQKNQPFPPFIDCIFKPLGGNPIKFKLSLEDLYDIEIAGWFMQRWLLEKNMSSKVMIESGLVPVLSTHRAVLNNNGIEENSCICNRFMSIAAFPEGEYDFRIQPDLGSIGVRLVIGKEEIFNIKDLRSAQLFKLNSSKVNGLPIILEQSSRAGWPTVSLDLRYENDTYDVAPYSWSKPGNLEQLSKEQGSLDGCINLCT
ncbi:MAG: glycosyltransferase family 39 protein, partial [SAR324 cluster bacterium]|nr:glycosyltransferase family 39 protein [SAR324 cluster bacterium]